MEEYVAFLRGINISGKNKIDMKDLKKEFEGLGFLDVKTYLNSGNVIYRSLNDNEKYIEEMILKRFGLNIKVYTLSKKRLKEILDKAPKWWNDENTYNNLIFILNKENPRLICNMIGEPSKWEKIEILDEVIFHSFDKKNYQKCNYWKKSAAKGIGEKLTIRTANTLKKIVS